MRSKYCNYDKIANQAIVQWYAVKLPYMSTYNLRLQKNNKGKQHIQLKNKRGLKQKKNNDDRHFTKQATGMFTSGFEVVGGKNEQRLCINKMFSNTLKFLNEV